MPRRVQRNRGNRAELAYAGRPEKDVEQTALSLLTPWNSFYVIAGSAAAALTGLQFVVIAVAAQTEIGSEGTTRAFGTPTIVHFCAVLLVSAVVCAPWRSVGSAAWALEVCALAGTIYTLAVVRHARRQTDYVLVVEDWIWHTALPLIAYLALFGAAIALRIAP